MTCLLCQQDDRPMTREHIFAHWLVLKVHGARLVASARSSGSTPSSTADARIARTIATGVCAECNAGWMSSLEVSFRRMVFAHPRVGILPPPDRVALSRWFTKTAVLLAHAQGGELLEAARRAQLVSGMPDDVEVFLARRRRPPQRLDFAVDLDGDGIDASGERRVRSVAILVDDLVGRVALRDMLGSRHGTRLWPLRTHALRWETLPVTSSHGL
jgi:hypothetical protein